MCSFFVLDEPAQAGKNENKQRIKEAQNMIKSLYSKFGQSSSSAVSDLFGLLSIFLVLFVALALS